MAVIHTAPSTVARQIAPSRQAMIAPGGPAQDILRPRIVQPPGEARDTVSGMPGWPDAAWSLRITVPVSSERPVDGTLVDLDDGSPSAAVRFCFRQRLDRW